MKIGFDDDNNMMGMIAYRHKLFDYSYTLFPLIF